MEYVGLEVSLQVLLMYVHLSVTEKGVLVSTLVLKKEAAASSIDDWFMCLCGHWTCILVILELLACILYD